MVQRGSDLLHHSRFPHFPSVLHYLANFALVKLFSVSESYIFRFFIACVHPNKFFFQFCPPPPIQIWKLEQILDTRIHLCLWGEGRSWACVHWKEPQKCRSVPRLTEHINSLRASILWIPFQTFVDHGWYRRHLSTSWNSTRYHNRTKP